MSDHPVFTYQTRLTTSVEQSRALGETAFLFSQAQRQLFARMADAGDPLKIKKEFMAKAGVDSRQYNAVRMELQGKIDSVVALRSGYVQDQEHAIASLKKLIKKLSIDPNKVKKSYKVSTISPKKSKAVVPVAVFESTEKRIKRLNKLHQKKRRLHRLEAKLARIKADIEADRVRLCFGSKKLFHAQFDLYANGYDSHEDWLVDWRKARSSQFFVVGSKDETAGCSACQATQHEDGSLTLRVKLPEHLVAEHGTHIQFSGVKFTYGHEQIVHALNSSERVESKTKTGKPVNKRTGTALTYRFMQDNKGWRVFVSVAIKPPKIVSQLQLGAIGLDINADHLALSEIDRSGNLIHIRRIALPIYGKSSDQAQAIIFDATKVISLWAKDTAKPVVMELLDFAKKKRELNSTNPQYARMLSSFACNKIASGVSAACFREGVEVIEVNPAYTSVIGAVNFAQVTGISVHQGAAYAIARRGLGFCESPTRREGIVPTRNGGHVTFALPVRNVAKHVWSFWSGVRKELKAAHVEHYRCGDGKKPPPPLRRCADALCATDISRARFPHASGLHRAGDDHPDVPF